MKSISAFLVKYWHFLKKFPKGNFLFSKMLSYMIPYTGSIFPLVLKLENGSAMVQLRDRSSVRNHLKSVHAIALLNVGELTTGLSLISQLDRNMQAILTHIEATYLKKARGTLIAEANSTIGKIEKGDSEHKIAAEIRNQAGELVCQVLATWSVRTVMPV